MTMVHDVSSITCKNRHNYKCGLMSQKEVDAFLIKRETQMVCNLLNGDFQILELKVISDEKTL